MSVRSEDQPFLDVRDITRLVGPASFARGQEYASLGAVLDTSWDSEGRILTGRVAGTARQPYDSRIRFSEGGGRNVVSSCTCPVGGNCKHVAATLIRRNLVTLQERMAEQEAEARPEAKAPVTPAPPDQPSWKTAVVALTTPGAGNGANGRHPELTPMGLLFELREI